MATPGERLEIAGRRRQRVQHVPTDTDRGGDSQGGRLASDRSAEHERDRTETERDGERRERAAEHATGGRPGLVMVVPSAAVDV
jgi:hypothetical protein